MSKKSIDIEFGRTTSSSIDAFFSNSQNTNKRVASSVGTGRIRIASVNELSGFKVVASDTLVHLSKQDFWKLGQDEEGHYIERLVTDDEGPVKG
jgi:hypothetical protein